MTRGRALIATAACTVMVVGVGVEVVRALGNDRATVAELAPNTESADFTLVVPGRRSRSA